MQGQCETCLAKIQCPNCGHDAKQKAVLLRSLRAEVKQLTDNNSLLVEYNNQLMSEVACLTAAKDKK